MFEYDIAEYSQINPDLYRRELRRLQAEFLKLQKWIIEEKKKIGKNPIKLSEVTQKKEKKVEKQDIEISSSASILEEIQQLEETRLVDVKEIDKNLLRTDVEKYSYLIQRQVKENWP